MLRMILFGFFLIYAIGSSDEIPGDVSRGRIAFEAVNGKDPSLDEIKPIIAHDIAIFRKLIKGTKPERIGDYYLGLLSFIENSGNLEYLPFVKEVIDECGVSNYLRGGVSPYLDKYDKARLYSKASSVWFSLSKKGKAETDVIDLVVQSLDAANQIPKFDEEVWGAVKGDLINKRTEIYEILLNKKIKLQYDFRNSNGEFSISSLFAIPGIEPKKGEIDQILANKENIQVQENLINYLIEIEEKTCADRIFTILSQRYDKLVDNKEFDKFYRYNYLIDRMLVQLKACLDDEQLNRLQNLTIKTLETIDPIWKQSQGYNINRDIFEYLLIRFYKLRNQLNDVSRNYLIEYARRIKRQIGSSNSEEKNQKLIGYFQEIQDIVGGEIK